MAGLGRRSHYRKHLTDAVLHDFPEPSNQECIAKVVATRGSNQFDVLLSNEVDTPQLAILPSKFHKLIWLKRGDFCIVETGTDEQEEDSNSGVRNMITHILYKEQIKHLKAKNLWPNSKEFETNEEDQNWKSEEEEENDGIVFDSAVTDEEYFVNTNRIKAMQIQDSSDSESSNDIPQNETDDVIEFDTQDDELFANTNRVAALKICESESDSSVDEKEGLQRNEQFLERGESIEFDTGKSRNMNRLTTMQMRNGGNVRSMSDGLIYDTADAEEVEEPEGESDEDSIHQNETNEFDTGNKVGRSMSDGLIYDTADAEEVEEPEGESDEDSIHQNETNEGKSLELGESIEFDTGRNVGRSMSDGLIYDTADAEEVDEPEGESESDEDSIHQNETDDGLVYDTADADEVDPDANQVSDESDDEKLDLTKTETDDGIEFDTANEQESEHDVV